MVNEKQIVEILDIALEHNIFLTKEQATVILDILDVYEEGYDSEDIANEIDYFYDKNERKVTAISLLYKKVDDVKIKDLYTLEFEEDFVDDYIRLTMKNGEVSGSELDSLFKKHNILYLVDEERQ